MLVRLLVRNFALIEEFDIEFGRGFNALTGETGAGKSMVIDAVNALLGARVGADLVRRGAAQARVEGIFDVGALDSEDLRRVVAELGVEPEDGQLILGREVAAGGRSLARVNGRAMPAGALQQLGQILVDVHGQSENLSLLRTVEQLALLDAFAGTTAARAQMGEQVVELRAAQRELAGLARDAREIARRIDLLRFQVDEIRAAAPVPGEDEELRAERNRLANAGRLVELGERAHALLADAGPGERAAEDTVGEVVDALVELARVDPAQGELASQAIALADALAVLARAVRAYGEAVELDPDRLAEVEERLEAIKQLQRKYGATIQEVLRYADEAEAELATIEGSDERAAALRRRQADLLAAVAEAAAELSRRRREAASRLGGAVEAELARLTMAGARFAIDLRQVDDPEGLALPGGRVVAYDAGGIDRVEFTISANPGEPLRPLARVVSGGETSRIMLALKGVLAEVDRVPILIFDEVDQGVGRSGGVVGEKLAGLARHHQVLCVTHLPQIAAYADRHFRIEKQTDGDRTRTLVRALEGDERVEELAAMSGGVTESARGRAREMLAAARGGAAAEAGPATASASVAVERGGGRGGGRSL